MGRPHLAEMRAELWHTFGAYSVLTAGDPKELRAELRWLKQPQTAAAAFQNMVAKGQPPFTASFLIDPT